MNIPAAKGYAIVTEVGAIITNTVSPTIRGAQVNWLIATEGMMITNGHTDGMIEAIFNHQSRLKKVVCIPVLINAGEGVTL